VIPVKDEEAAIAFGLGLWAGREGVAISRDERIAVQRIESGMVLVCRWLRHPQPWSAREVLAWTKAVMTKLELTLKRNGARALQPPKPPRQSLSSRLQATALPQAD
jgi:hypothetical protein